MPELLTNAYTFERRKESDLFAGSFDKAALIKPAKIVVVGQRPAADALVPLGTKVDLEVSSTDTIPITGFRIVDTAWAQSPYKTVGDFEAALAKTDDPSAPLVKAALDSKAEYQGLSATDKAAVDTFIAARFGASANKENVYGNMMFFRNL